MIKEKAFTLIEILATITIIVLLSGIIVYGINSYKEDAQLKGVIAFSQEIYAKLGEGLVARWDFNENASDTSIYDSGRFGHTITPTSITKQESGCIENSCLEFLDASNSFITGSNLNNKEFNSFCLWLKTEETDIDYIMTKRNGLTEQDGDFDLYLSSKKPGIRIYSGDGSSVSLLASATTLSDVEIDDGDWHLICASIKEGPIISIYVDGKQSGWSNCIANSFGGGSHPIYFGGYDSSSANADIWIDSVMLFEGSIE